MRLVSALLFVALTGSVTLANEAKPADPKPEVSKRKVPLRVVRMLPETHQVLLMDKNRGSHVVAEVGQDVDGYFVEEITDEEVTLVAPNGAEIILAAPDMTWRRRAAERRAAAAKSAKAPAVKTEPAPIDPYADEPAPVDGTADAGIEPGEGGVRVASAGDAGPTAAPIVDAGPPELASDPYADADAGVTAFADAVGATSPADAPPAAKPAKATPDPKADAGSALAAAATGTPAPAATATQFTISRRDVDTALADFGATAVTFNAAFVSEGLRIDSIAEGTILGKVGLRKGDVITSIDGKPLRTFDDAADLYARAGTAKQSTIQVMRAGKPTTLRVTIR